MAFAAVDTSKPQIIYTDVFQGQLNALDGAIRCHDKIHSGFGDYPGAITMSNRGGRFGYDRVRDSGHRVERIDSFEMPLPDSMTCKSIAAQIPRGNNSVDIKRDLEASLVTLQGTAQLLIKEIVTLQISPEIALVGEQTWNDFAVFENQINPGRDFISLLLDHDATQTTATIKLRPLIEGISCQQARLNNGGFQLNLNLPGGHGINTTVVSRIFKSEKECVDLLSEMISEIAVTDIDNQGIEAPITRELSLVRRPTSVNGVNTAVTLVRTEQITIGLLGVRFSGASGLPLWSVM
jgi:hypothetical protein